jgi:hypothetical protein
MLLTLGAQILSLMNIEKQPSGKKKIIFLVAFLEWII